MVKVIDLLLKKRTNKDILVEAALTAYDRVMKKLEVVINGEVKEISINQNVWYTIVPGDPNSPKIMGLSDNKSLIYYPKNSTAYSHSLVDKCKFATILSGCVYDELSGKKFSAERIEDGNPHCIKIKPEDNFIPYTKDCECYVLVHVDDCKKTLSEICG